MSNQTSYEASGLAPRSVTEIFASEGVHVTEIEIEAHVSNVDKFVRRLNEAIEATKKHSIQFENSVQAIRI